MDKDESAREEIEAVMRRGQQADESEDRNYRRNRKIEYVRLYTGMGYDGAKHLVDILDAIDNPLPRPMEGNNE